MAWTVSTFTIVVFGSAVVALVVGLAALRERPDPFAVPLAVLMFAIAAWAIPDAISFGFTDPGRVVFWQRMSYLGIVSAPVAYLVFTLEYAGFERWRTRRVASLLAIVPLVTVGAVWTNPYHGLFWRAISVAEVGDASVLLPVFGPWYWVNLGYLYLVTLVSLSILGTVVIRSGTIYRKQAALMFVGGLVPLVTNVAMQFGLGPDPTVDLTTTALTVSGLTYALALFHLDLLEIRPVARDWLFDELDDGVVVVGSNGRIRDFNKTASSILGDIALEQPAEEILPTTVVPDGGELVMETAAGERRFRARSTTLTDRRGEAIGRIVYLNDVTEVVLREQRISVLNRILRHNIRNELNVVCGSLELLENHAGSAEASDQVETAMESTRQVIGFAEKARLVERTLRRRESPAVISAVTVAEQVVSDAEGTYSHAVLEFVSSDGTGDGAPVRVVGVELLETAIAELVENAIDHNDRSPPRVTVRVETRGDRVGVKVIDNGTGIPDQEARVLTSHTETHLEHSSGLGLWLAQWCASLSSGELSFAENDPHGTIVTLTLPRAGE